jgi:hypothetical protein
VHKHPDIFEMRILSRPASKTNQTDAMIIDDFFVDLLVTRGREEIPVIAVHPDNSEKDVLNCISEVLFGVGGVTISTRNPDYLKWRAGGNRICARTREGHYIVPFAWVHDVANAGRNANAVFSHYIWFPNNIYDRTE